MNYLSASERAIAEKALLEGIAEIDAHYYDRTMEMVGNIAAQVRQIFTEEQWTALKRRFGTPKSNSRIGRER